MEMNGLVLKSVGKREDEDNRPPHWKSGGPNYRTRLGLQTQLKEDGIRVILSDAFLMDSGRCMVSL